MMQSRGYPMTASLDLLYNLIAVIFIIFAASTDYGDV